MNTENDKPAFNCVRNGATFYAARKYISCFLISAFTAAVSQNGLCDEARALYEKGKEFYNKELYEEASQAFRQLQTIRPSYKVSFNIGQCELLRKRYDLAIESFEAYLSGGSDNISEERKEYIYSVLLEIKPSIGRLGIEEGREFEIWIDDELRGGTPLDTPIYLLTGEHRVTLKDGSITVFEETYVIKTEQLLTIDTTASISLEETNTEEPNTEEANTRPIQLQVENAEDISAEEPSRKRHFLCPVGIAISSIGIAGTIAGGITAGFYLLKKDELDKECPDSEACGNDNMSLYSDANTLSTTTNLLLPIGGAVFAAGILTYVVGRIKETGERDDESISYLGPSITKDSIGMLLGFKF